jgi:O-acetyl-ADP-ribose deacetylase (regulator of RNase III)
MIDVHRGDITTLEVDAIVNAANAALSGGGGVDGALQRAAGPELLVACRALGRCPTGSAVLTPGFDLPARYVIHAVGPVWCGGEAGEAQLLAAAYRAVFRVALEQGTITSIALPCISTGIYRFPRGAAAEIAVAEMRAAEGRFARIVACVFDSTDEQIYRALLG